MKTEIITPADIELQAAAEQGDAGRVGHLIVNDRANVNYQDPHTKLTALHLAAGRNAVLALRAIVRSQQCDFTLTDAWGRTAATLAIEIADNPVLGRYLLDKEDNQRRNATLRIGA